MTTTLAHELGVSFTETNGKIFLAIVLIRPENVIEDDGNMAILTVVANDKEQALETAKRATMDNYLVYLESLSTILTEADTLLRLNKMQWPS